MAPIDIQTALAYSIDTGKPRYYFAREQTEEEKKSHPIPQDPKANNKTVDILVRDGRDANIKLDVTSFELIKQETSLSTEDFYDHPEKITTIYYEEMAETIKKATGAEHVVVFHHQVRNKDRNNGSNTNINTSIQGYAEGIHSDSHPVGAEQTFGYVAANVDEKYHKGRFLYVNAWRNISDTPIGDNHLAMCDETSLVKPDDYLVSQLFGQGYTIPQYVLSARNSDQHKWYYFSKMNKGEVILFKQWDSDRSLEGRVCFHTAFKDPKAPVGTPTRESIEVRAFAFFPNHEPNSCPEIMIQPAFSEEREKNRVKSKHIFNFTLDGTRDEEVAKETAKYKAYADQAKASLKTAAETMDDGTALSHCMRGMTDMIMHHLTFVPYFGDMVNKCEHDQLKIPPSYGNDHEVSVYIHRPKSLKGEKCAAIVYAHGGGVISGKAEDFKGQCSNIAEMCGVAVFNVDYRLAPEAKCPKNILDVYSALKHIIDNADDLNIDATRVAILGENGGGYIVYGLEVMLAQNNEASLVKLAVPVVPMVDDYHFGDTSTMTDEEKEYAVIQRMIWKAIATDLKTQGEDPLLFPGKASNDLLEKFPPTVVFDVEFDYYITESERMARRLRSAGRLLEMVVQPGLGQQQAMSPKLAKFHEMSDIIKKIVEGYLIE